jgi:hypothetical protein
LHLCPNCCCSFKAVLHTYEVTPLVNSVYHLSSEVILDVGESNALAEQSTLEKLISLQGRVGDDSRVVSLHISKVIELVLLLGSSLLILLVVEPFQVIMQFVV